MDKKEKSTSDNTKQMAVQCWLEEHRALRAVIELHFTTMRYLVIFNIAALGTISGLILTDMENNMWLALIVPILSAFIGFLVYFYSKQISRLGHYIRDTIAKRLHDLVEDEEVIGWESHTREEEKERNKLLQWFSISGMSLLTFILTSTFALIFTAKQTFLEGAVWQIILWITGLILTILLIPAFISERKFWFGEETRTNKEQT